jgi:N-methylhydantoinase A
MSRTARIGVDIGGTFTDLVLHDEARGVTRAGKRLTTPEAPSRAIIEGIARLLAETATPIGDVAAIVHGTTLITNTVLERTGAKVGLLATEGFRDTLEMGRESRYDVNDLFLQAPPSIVPRPLRHGIGGRLLADGTERAPLDEAAVAQAVRQLVERDGIEALAIAFLHAYRNPAHERRAAEIVGALYPGLLVSLSADVAPEIREYERTTTACLNAYVQPRVHAYLDRLRDDLSAMGFAGDLTIMLSGGGITSVEDARRFPIRMIESGPAAGATAAAFMARLTGEDRVIAFDMGGTTAKMSVIDQGRPKLRHDFEAGRLRKFMAGSGLPLKVTVIDMIEIGSGGGSIAAVDPLGLLKVGPRSAGSVPGPVCYNRGGTEPTVTDADLLLGHLDPAYFLGGEMALAQDKVREAVAHRLAQPLGITPQAALSGIRGIVDDSMAAATRMHLAEQGKDPRAYTLFAFGGAGPVHAWSLARLLNVRRVIVPMGAGVFSALGFLVAAPVAEGVRGYLTPVDDADWDHVNRIFAAMEAEALALLRHDPSAVLRWSADMRYAGQGFEIGVDIPRGPLSAADIPAIREAFVAAYAERFGRTVRDVGIEVVNWRLSGALPGQHITLAHEPGTGDAHRGTRDVAFEGHGTVTARVYDRYALARGRRIAGPAVLEERESSCAFGPGATAFIDAWSNLVIDMGEGEKAAASGTATRMTEETA